MKTSWNIGRPDGLPVRVHGTLLLTVVLVLLLRPQPVFVVSVLGVLAVHLLGHGLMARLVGVRVLQVDIDGLGGRVVSSGLANRSRRVLVACGGVLAQLVLLVGAVLADILLEYPQHPAWSAMVAAFTTANAFILVSNLLPLPGNDGGEVWSFVADRSPAWEARAERWWGKPSGRASKAPQFPQTPDGEPSPELQAYLDEVLRKPRNDQDEIN